MSDTLVITPTYNEKENIENIIRKVFSLDKGFDMLIIEDNSPDGTADIVKRLMQEKLRDSRHELAVYAERFQGLSPLHRLESGYSYVAGDNGKAVTSTSQVQPGDVVSIYVTDGSYRASVLEITERPEDHV